MIVLVDYLLFCLHFTFELITHNCNGGVLGECLIWKTLGVSVSTTLILNSILSKMTFKIYKPLLKDTGGNSLREFEVIA